MAKLIEVPAITNSAAYKDFCKNPDAGALLEEYIGESEHASWEGYDDEEEKAIYAFITDLLLFVQNR